MRVLPLIAVAVLSTTAVSQQNFVKNGEFTILDAQGMPLLWKVDSKPFHNFQVIDHSQNSVPIFKKAVRCQPGGSSAYTKPYPLVVLEQQVTLPAGVPLEFSMDVAYSKDYLGTNSDRGQIGVQVGNQSLGLLPATRQSITDITTEVDHFNARFRLKAGGNVTLKITVERFYYATQVYCHLDNVFLGIQPGAAFGFAGDRKVGSNFDYRFIGEPNSTCLAVLSTGPAPGSGGISLPGFSGTLQLDPTFLMPMWTEALPASGEVVKNTGPFPNVPGLKGVQFWWQSLQITTTPPALTFGTGRPFAWF